MAVSPDALRRRAACAAFSPVLGEDALIDALWLQHERMRGDAVSDIIACVDAVAAQHLLDAATRKRLYASFFEALRQSEDTLPMDPWPLMQARRPVGMAAPAPASGAAAPRPTLATQAPAVPAPAVVPASAPVAAAPAVPEPAAAPALPDRPAHEAVFTALIGAILAGVRQFHGDASDDLRSACRARIDRVTGVPAALRQQVRDALAQKDLESWHLQGSPAHLSALTHEVYVALCEALGPVDADQVLMQAVRQAAQLPQAREFAPERLL